MAAAKRKSIGKKLRFDIFKRDGFACQYCGATPPNSVLEIDHINPVANGGTNDIDNLITACCDCNRGKGAHDLAVAPATLIEKAEVIEEKREQLRAYERLLRNQKVADARKVRAIEKIYQQSFPDFQFTADFKRSVRSFLQKLPKVEVEDAMEIACDRTGEPGPAIKYFCGICWNKIREVENA